MNPNPKLSVKIVKVLGLAGSGLAGVLGGWTWAAGFLIGSVAAYFNLRNLIGIVDRLGRPESTGRMGALAWILFRFILLGAGALAIVRFTRISLLAVFAGLAVPVAAVILEALLELMHSR